MDSRKLNRGLARFLALFLLLFLAVGVPHNYSLAQDDCTIRQVTDAASGESEVAFLNFSGTLGAFSSSADIDGGNPDGSFEAYIFNTGTLVITQLTDDPVLDSFIFDISGDEAILALSSQADLTGGNPDGNREIFLFDRDTELFTQITDTSGVDNIVPALNFDGSLIAIDSQADLTGENADANREIFLFDSGTATFTQLTDTTAGDSLAPDISSDGEIIGFHSSADLTGDNADGSLEVFLFDTVSDTFTQITDGAGLNSATVALSSDGSIVGLNSDTSPTGENADANREIFIFDTGADAFTQVTDTTGDGNSGPSISSDGTRLVFTTAADLTGENADGNREVFLFDADTGITTQVTDTTGGLFSGAVISGDGTRILFSSSSNIGGGNPDGSEEIYFADCRAEVVNGGNGNGGCALAGDASPKQGAVNAGILTLALLVGVLGVIKKRKAN